MGALIDRDALCAELQRRVGSPEGHRRLMEVNRCICDAPAVDAVPVVHGRWVRTDSDTTSAIEYSCSICGDRAPMGYMRQNAKTEYCPHCGARMDA